MTSVSPDLMATRTCGGCRHSIDKHAKCEGRGNMSPGRRCNPIECQNGWDRTSHADDCPNRNQAMFPFVSVDKARDLENLASRASRYRRARLRRFV